MAYRYVTLFFLTLSSYASSCCGGGANLPNIILGDRQWETKFSYTNSAVTHESNANGEVSKVLSKNEVTETLSLKAAYLFEDYFQLAIDIPFKKRTSKVSTLESSKEGLIDPSIQVTYEFLPELGYNKYKPRGFAYIKQLFPIGNSIYDFEDPLLADSLSKGVYETTLGFAFFKVIGLFDYSYTAEIHHGFKTTISDKEVYPGFGYSTSLGIGISANSKLRFGSALTYWQDSAVETDGVLGTNKYYLSGSLNTSYLFEEKSLLLTYTNENIAGVSKNTNLSQSILLEFKVFKDL